MMAMNRKLGTGNRIQTIENFVDTNISVSSFHPTFIDKLIELVPVNWDTLHSAQSAIRYHPAVMNLWTESALLELPFF